MSMKQQYSFLRAARSVGRCGEPFRQTHQAGVGLIEVLVALLVLSIGFLGVAALEAFSLSTNNSAMARSMATINSYSVLDAMRADILNAQNGAYNTTVSANSCPATGATLASQQLNQWCGSLGSALGMSTATTGTINCSGTGACTITITFDDSRAGSALGSNAQTFTTRGVL
jgi:type IV pilus assembly protein PilV